VIQLHGAAADAYQLLAISNRLNADSAYALSMIALHGNSVFGLLHEVSQSIGDRGD
jgi:hypothetical protein